SPQYWLVGRGVLPSEAAPSEGSKVPSGAASGAASLSASGDAPASGSDADPLSASAEAPASARLDSVRASPAPPSTLSGGKLAETGPPPPQPPANKQAATTARRSFLLLVASRTRSSLGMGGLPVNVRVVPVR